MARKKTINAEDASRQLTQGLRTLLEVADELLGCADVETVIRRAVELARGKLGLERCSVVMARGEMIHGTFGTNLRGETTDERLHEFPMDARWRECFTVRPHNERRWTASTAMLYEFDGAKLAPLGRSGEIATTPIQTAERAIGVFCNDNAISGAPLNPTTQEVIAVYCSMLGNIIWRKQAEIESERSELRQRTVMERTDRLNSLGLLAAGMAHEINNPLQGMLSHLHLARKKLPMDFAAHHHLDMVGKGIETIATLVRKLLALGSTSERGSENATCGEVIGFVTNLLESQLTGTRVTISINDAKPRATVAMPRRELIQVVLNLVINARDAMPKGGVITLNAEADSQTATICVGDTGQGIPPELIPQIFTPFFTTKGTRGTGLGLSVVESLVRNCGGSIDVQSTPGQGSTFTLRLPLAPDG